MFTFLLWCILFVVCWPLALLALVLYPFVWILLLPFRLVGIAVHGALELVWAAVIRFRPRLLSQRHFASLGMYAQRKLVSVTSCSPTLSSWAKRTDSLRESVLEVERPCVCPLHQPAVRAHTA